MLLQNGNCCDGHWHGIMPDSDDDTVITTHAGGKSFFTDAAGCHAAVRAEGAELNWSYKDITDQDAEWIAAALTDPAVRVFQTFTPSCKQD